MEDKGSITLILHNDSIHPPHFEQNMKVRYFFNISGLIAKRTPDDIMLRIFIDEQQTSYEGSIAVQGPLAWDARRGIYYYEFDWSGYDVWGRRTLQFALITAATAPSEHTWNPQDDWSYRNLTSTQKVTPYIPVYLNGERVYGEEPPA